ncbi:MAG: glycosyltransferase [Actinomycetota bacterium]
MSTAEVTVIVVTFNSAPYLPSLLASLPEALKDVAHELIVVDNCSDDGSAELVGELAPAARVVKLSENLGYAAGFNAGCAASSSSGALLLLNPDIVLEPGSVARLLDGLNQPNAGIAVPQLRSSDKALQLNLRREPTVLRLFGQALLGVRAGRYERFGEVVVRPESYESGATADWATGAAMLISAGCLAKVGPWDESFFLYSEETDFALRARDAGYTLRYVKEAKGIHSEGESTTTAHLWALLVSNKLRLYRKRHPGRQLLFHLGLILGEGLRLGRSPIHRAALMALLRPADPRPQAAQTEKTGFLCFSAQDWWYFNRAHSDFQIMLQIARTRKVLLVNSIGMRMPLPGRTTQPLRRVLRKAASIARFVRKPLAELPNFNVISPLILPFYGLPAVKRLNAFMVKAQVSLVAKCMRIDRPHCVVTIPTAWDVVKTMRVSSLTYNRSDRHSDFGEAAASGIEALETQLMQHADHVVYASKTLMDFEAEVTESRARFLDHGVDLELFRRSAGAQDPPEMAALPAGPIIGFFGQLEDYTVDFDLLELVARRIPEAQLVLIGKSTASLHRFDSLPNVHLLGFKPYTQIPRYGSCFDVSLMPWLDNKWIRYCNPIKLKEYLALGLPVVTTDFPEAHRYQDVLLIARDHNDFIAKIREALRSDSDEKRQRRRAAVEQSTWDRVAAELIVLSEAVGAGHQKTTNQV